MIKVLTLKKTWIVFFIAMIFSFIMATAAHAQTASSSSEVAAKKYGITFPVAELGNCNSLAECKTYCADSTHQTECVEFAKKKGFYKQPEKQPSIVDAAKNELGCDSESACKEFCSQQQNWEKCGEFAKKHRLSAGKTEDIGKNETLNKAKQLLGCDSVDTCKNFCQKEENKQKCDEFAKLVGLRGGIEKKGPAEAPHNSNTATFSGEIKKGPANAFEMVKQRQEQFMKTCKENPQKCETIEKQNPEMFNCYKMGKVWNGKECHDPGQEVLKTAQPIPAEMSQKCVAYGCSWTGTSCNCTNRVTTSPGSAPSPTNIAPVCQPPANGCGAGSAFDKSTCACRSYEDYCKSKSGCSWTGTSCSCTNVSSTSLPTIQPSIENSIAPSQIIQ